MNTNMIINKLSTKRNGQFFNISYVSDLPMTAKAKREGIVALKITKATVRKGISYKNMKSVQERLGDRINEPLDLPWGSWVPEHKGLLIEHKGKTYLRLYSSPNKNKSVYLVNGKEISLDELKSMGIVQNSYWNKTGKPDCLTVNTANIEEIF